MTVAAPAQPWVGRPLARAEDVRFTTGTSAFVGDLHFEGMLHAAFVRSWSAHARLVGIDAEAALAARGVVAVLTARDLDGRVGRFPVNPIEDGEAADAPHPVLARDRVRYVGEPVAVVVAETPDAAVDAAELVVVDLDELPALVDPRAALEADTQLHDAAPGNALLRWRKSAGDVDGAFAAAAHVARVSVRAPRLVASPLEPRGAVAAYDAADDLLTVHVSAQDPYRQLSGLCRVLDRPPERLRVVVPDVGGAFGSKGVPAAETAAVALAALELGRPVRWLETRTENFLSSYQGRGLEADAELALDGEGRMLALRARIVGDLGAYLYPTTPVAPVTAAMLLTGCYAIPAAEVEIVGAATNKVPTGPYRGAGRPEAALVLERLVDVAARELGVDPVELRRRNLIPADAFPYETPLGFTYDSGDYARALDTALELAAYARVREDQEAARRGGRLVGVGVALYVERCGPGSETAAVRVEPGGRVVCRTGSSPHGQGHETTFAQIAADALGVDPVHVEIRWGDSQALPHGTGTFASRSVAVGGSALLLAAQRVKEQWEEARRAAGRDLSLAEAAPLDADARFELSGPVFSSGAYVAVVEVEPDTGEVTVRSIAAVDDCGRVVNPLLAEGQVVGAAVQAIGECLYEEVGYDERGQPLAVNLYDYHLPTAFAVPPIASALLETPSPLNPLGAKGVGEGGSIGTPAAIANAVADALAPLGVRHADLPFTPARVWKVIETASTNRSGADHEAD
jgi:carbon-monoxide dehydrogenase large subunit